MRTGPPISGSAGWNPRALFTSLIAIVTLGGLGHTVTLESGDVLCHSSGIATDVGHP